MEMSFNIEKTEDLIKLNNFFIAKSFEISQIYSQIDALNAQKESNADFKRLTQIGKKLFIGDIGNSITNPI